MIPSVGFIGFGEAGSAIAAGLRSAGATRLCAYDIHCDTPIFGPKMKPPAGEPATREERLLADSGIPREAFERFSNLTPGTRRPYLVWPGDMKISGEAEGIRLEFSLPSGSYATVVLREFQKTP